ncbi:MAG: M23 family metallopeptidase [Dehalococcoidia bacterium]
MVLGGAFRQASGEGAPATAEPVTLDESKYLDQPVVLSTSSGVVPRPEEPIEEATATPTPAPTAEPTPVPELPPMFYTYVIQPGDSIDTIAVAFGISPEYILWNNNELGSDPNYVVAGQEILVPSIDGLIYRVKLGDTISDIAAYYGIDLASIIDFAPNELGAPEALIEGKTLVLPGAVPPPPPPPPPPEPEPVPVPASPSPAPGGLYVWPFIGPITSYYGEPRGPGVYHLGIDIDGYGQAGTPVVAAAAGQVVLVVAEDVAFGNYVIVRHDDGSETLYAHLSDIWVGYGQYVAQGEGLGGVGNTGYVIGTDGTHLHFEMWIGGAPVDPLLYLP